MVEIIANFVVGGQRKLVYMKGKEKVIEYIPANADWRKHVGQPVQAPPRAPNVRHSEPNAAPRPQKGPTVEQRGPLTVPSKPYRPGAPVGAPAKAPEPEPEPEPAKSATKGRRKR